MSAIITNEIRDAVDRTAGGPVELPDSKDTVYVVMNRQKFQTLVHGNGDAVPPQRQGKPKPYDLEIDEELDYTSPPARTAPPIRMRLVVRGQRKPMP